jgi:glutamate-1-semialdehyde 2,1-aminomutase
MAMDLLQRADSAIAGGHINVMRFPEDRRLAINYGRGARLFDFDGRVFVDYLLGSGPMILGHAREEVVEAVKRQVERGSSFYSITAPTVELAERVIELNASAEVVRFCSTGTEATMFALRLARAATGRSAILKFEGAFHGGNDYALMSLSPQQALSFPRAEPSSKGIPAVLEPEVLVAPFNDIEATGNIIKDNANRIAAIIVEPVQRAIPPQPGFLEELHAMTRRHGIVLIFDEVVTGFRVAPGGAQELYGVSPDLATYGKILGGGHPTAAVGGSREIMSQIDGSVFMSGTLSGNPVAATAGLATLDVLSKPGTYEYLTDLGDRMRSGLTAVLRQRGLPACAIGVGPVFQLFFRSEAPQNYRECSDSLDRPSRELATFMFDHGVLFTGNKGYLSTEHTTEDVDEFISLAGAWADKFDAHRGKAQRSTDDKREVTR